MSAAPVPATRPATKTPREPIVLLVLLAAAMTVSGLAPAVLARELLLRKTRLRPGGWLFWLVALSCLGGSAVYEILEWWAAKLSGFEAAAFLATQGDVWDTQWDMFLGLAGAVAGQLLFGRLQDREIAEVDRPALA